MWQLLTCNKSKRSASLVMFFNLLKRKSYLGFLDKGGYFRGYNLGYGALVSALVSRSAGLVITGLSAE